MAKRKKPYRSHIKIGVDAEGKDILKYYQGYTRAELEQAKQALRAKYITGEALADDRLFGDYASEWYRVKKEPFVSASSKESYRTALNRNLFPVLGEKMMRAITSMELQEIVNGLKDMSATKITVVLAAIRGIFRSALSDRLIDTDPSKSLVRPSASAPSEKVALTPEQRVELERVCREHPQGHYLALMYYLGVRPGEARGLQWGDIDWKGGVARIERDIDYKAGGRVGELKTEKSRRRVPMPAQLRAILEPMRGLPKAFIAHGDRGNDMPLAKASAERLWTELMLSAGLCEPAGENRYRATDPRHQWTAIITPHALRHNYITLCWENGLDPYETMKLVGHVSIKTTMDIYTHLSEAQLAKTAVKVDGMFNGIPSAQPWTPPARAQA